MTATVATLGARALRKVGLTPVAIVDQPSPGVTVPVAEIAAGALRALGVNPIASAQSAVNSGTTTLQAIATRALRRIAVTAGTETPFGADQTLAEEKATAVHEALAALSLVSWVGGAVPLLAAEQYTVMVAVALQPAFGIPADLQMSAGAMEIIRTMELSGAKGETLAESEVLSAHAVLNGLGLVSWGSTEIPGSVASAYETMATVRLAPTYGKPAVEDEYTAAVTLVRRIVMSGPVGQTMAEEKVRAVHASLDARGLTRWSIFDPPDYVEEPYVWMAAELLAPEVGQQAPQGLYAAGEKEIRRLISMPSARKPVLAEYF